MPLKDQCPAARKSKLARAGAWLRSEYLTGHDFVLYDQIGTEALDECQRCGMYHARHGVMPR